MARIAVDAMGGDHAPAEVVMGAIQAAADGVDVILVGDREVLAPVLERAGSDLQVAHASQVIDMHEDAARAIRDKKDASVRVAAGMVADGKAAGFVSAGSTGAAMAAAAFVVGRLDGVSRPAIASIFPTGKVLIDAGANLAVTPEQLRQFAVMGSAVAQVYMDVPSPRIGLLNVGEEAGKGRDMERLAFDVLKESAGINFIGNVEGRDLGGDSADVIVTDGFTGNVLLKTAEGVARTIYQMVLEALSPDEYQDALLTLMPAFLSLRKVLDPETVGGAHLVGTSGVVVIAHGSSSRVAMTNAIERASEGVEKGLVDRIARGIAVV